MALKPIKVRYAGTRWVSAPVHCPQCHAIPRALVKGQSQTPLEIHCKNCGWRVVFADHNARQQELES